MRMTAGLLICCDDKILLVKQRNGGYSIPKGEVKEGESHLDAAIRETEEECGIVVHVQNICKTEFLCSIDAEYCRRKLFYYKATIPESAKEQIRIKDSSEIENVILCGIEEAISVIQASQVAILWDGGRNVNPRILSRLVESGWVHVEKHPTDMLFIYDYTEQCKKESAWNELTMWCRGLITDEKGDIVAYPLKKFFELYQLYPECRNFDETFEVSEKMDGFLGITYFINGEPFIATRSSFISIPALRATTILYTKHLNDIPKMNSRYSYLFEIIYPNDFLVLNYGNLEDLFIIDVIDNLTGESVLDSGYSLSFPVIPREPGRQKLDYYLGQNQIGHEGFVLKFSNGNRLKVKFPWFKDEFKKKNG